jgi:hypothetical protein
VVDEPEEPSLAEWAERMLEILGRPKPPPEAGADKPPPVPQLTSDLSRETIVREATIRPFTPEAPKPQPMPEKPKSDFWTYADKAVFGLCELLALLFGLPFGDDLYHDKPLSSIGGWHWFYFVIAIFFAIGGPMWPWIRTQPWAAQAPTASVSRIAVNPYGWLAVLLSLFFYGVAPEMYQRATAPGTVLSPTSGSVPTNPSPAFPETPRFYSAAEKEELANRISAIYRLLNGDMLELAEQWFVVSTHNFRSKEDAEQFLKDLNALQVRTLAVNKKLWEDEVNGNPNFSAELRRLIAEDAPISKLESAIGNLMNGASLYFLMFDSLSPTFRDQFAQLLRPFQGEIFEGSTNLKKWVYETNERITEKRKSL